MISEHITKLKKFLLGAIVFLVLFASSTGSAFAGTCIPATGSHMFIGKTVMRLGFNTYLFKVERNLIGKVGPLAIVSGGMLGGDTTGYGFKTGNRYIVDADKGWLGYTTSFCYLTGYIGDYLTNSLLSTLKHHHYKETIREAIAHKKYDEEFFLEALQNTRGAVNLKTLRYMLKNSENKTRPLLLVLQELESKDDVQGIWDIYTSKDRPQVSWNFRMFAGPVTYAALKLGKELPPELNMTLTRGIRLNNANLKNANFSGALLWGAHFKNSNLSSANFQGATLYASFSDTDLKGADFRGAIFKNLTLYGNTNLSGGDFRDAVFHYKGGAISLNGLDLSNSRLENADLYRTKLNNTNLKGATYNCYTKWPKGFNIEGKELVYVSACDRKQTEVSKYNRSRVNSFYDRHFLNEIRIWKQSPKERDYSNMKIGRGNITHSDMQMSNFSNSDLSGLSFQGSNFSNSNFQNAKLEGICASGSYMCMFPGGRSPGKVSKTVFHGADFTGANLDLAVLRDADFSKAIFKNTSMFLTVYNCNTKWPEGFDPSIYGAILIDGPCSNNKYSKTKLVNTDLRKRKVINYNLGEVELHNVDLRGAWLQGSDFSAATLKNVRFSGATMDCKTVFPKGFSPEKHGIVILESYRKKCPEKYGAVDYSGFDLTELEKFPHTFAREANLKKVNLSGMRISAFLGGADFSEANLKGTDLSYATLVENGYPPPVFSGAVFDCNTIWPKRFNPTEYGAIYDASDCRIQLKRDTAMNYRDRLFSDWRLRDIAFPSNTKEWVIENKKLNWLNVLGRGRLKDVTFKNTILQNADFSGNQLDNVNFIQSDLRGIKWGKSFKNLSFKGSDLSGAIFPDDVNFYNVDWEGIVYDCYTQNLPLPQKQC